MLNKFFIFCLLGIVLLACGDKEQGYTDIVDCTDIDADQNTYDNRVKVILDGSCAFAGCHDAGTASNGIILDSYTGAKKEFVSGNALCAIYHDCTPMPQGSDKLSVEIIEELTCWVKNGAK
ncbi:MAG: hypothetical protein IPN29_09325 [Saprospiraceae bacterium]|nr:hypothetical protein [Saprospiraceae bacterium]